MLHSSLLVFTCSFIPSARTFHVSRSVKKSLESLTFPVCSRVLPVVVPIIIVGVAAGVSRLSVYDHAIVDDESSEVDNM